MRSGRWTSSIPKTDCGGDIPYPLLCAAAQRSCRCDRSARTPSRDHSACTLPCRTAWRHGIRPNRRGGTDVLGGRICQIAFIPISAATAAANQRLKSNDARRHPPRLPFGSASASVHTHSVRACWRRLLPIPATVVQALRPSQGVASAAAACRRRRSLRCPAAPETPRHGCLHRRLQWRQRRSDAAL
jgi:hypothetical protein